MVTIDSPRVTSNSFFLNIRRVILMTLNLDSSRSFKVKGHVPIYNSRSVSCSASVDLIVVFVSVF